MNAIFIFFLMTTTVVGVIIDLSPPTAPNPHYTNKKFQGQRDIPSASSRLVLSNNLASGLVIQWRMRKCELGYETPVKNVGTRWCFALVSACCLFSSLPQYHIAFKETKPSVSFTLNGTWTEAARSRGSGLKLELAAHANKCVRLAKNKKLTTGAKSGVFRSRRCAVCHSYVTVAEPIGGRNFRFTCAQT